MPEEDKAAKSTDSNSQVGVTTGVSAELSLASLAVGMPGLTPACGQILAEAAAVCLEDRRHTAGVKLECVGLRSDYLLLAWLPVDDRCRRSHADLQEATERGACGIAILTIRHKTGMVVVQRSRKGTGFDYWLGGKDEPSYDDDVNSSLFSTGARLEVSGILSGTKAQISTRMRQKKEQIALTDSLGEGFVVVVEFGTPIVHVECK